MSHTFHLIFILLLQFYFDAHNFEERGVATVLGGAIAYVFMYLMALTSTDKMVNWLGKRKWKWLHPIGGYYIITVFSVGYIPRAIDDYQYLPFAIAIILSLTLKFLTALFKIKT